MQFIRVVSDQGFLLEFKHSRLTGCDELTARLHDIADPTSPNFGRHMSHEDITAITATDTAASAVIAYLESQGAKILKSTKHGEYITASWSVQGWEEVLDTEFFRFEHADGEFLRALQYSLPIELVGLVHAVFNTVQVVHTVTKIRACFPYLQ